MQAYRLVDPIVANVEYLYRLVLSQPFRQARDARATNPIRP